MTILCILAGPSVVLREDRDDVPRWCFGERKRHPGTWQLMGDAEPSYYDPIWVYRCDGCGHDRRDFPGTWYE